jgi:hypothetical protein
MESLGGSATSISLSDDEEVLAVAPPVVVVLLKNAILDRQVERRALVKSTKNVVSSHGSNFKFR